MKFNTLTFDANLPTVQQVNVPTNTDYKVGMKVKRNGEVQQLGPDEITIYTGEITPGDTTVVGPADSPSNLERTVNGTNKTTIFMMFPKVSLSAYADKFIAPSDIEQTWHLSGETTSTPLNYGDLEIGYGVQYVEGTTVWYSYQGKWCRIASGQIAEKKDRVQVTDTALMRQNFNLQTAVAEVFFNGTIPTAQAPILVDSTITFHDEDTPVTIPTDAEKTNGYVTITRASGDNASFKQYGVHIEHGYDSADSIKTTGQFPSTSPTPNPSQVRLTAADLGIAGKVIKASDYANIEYWMYRGATPAPDDYSTWTVHKESIFTYPDRDWAQQIMAPTGTTAPLFITKLNEDIGPFPDDYPEPSLRGKSVMEVGKWYFAEAEINGGQYVWRRISETKVFQPDEIVIYLSGARFTANYYWGRLTKFAFGTPFSADFKLNINEFKSQQGDIAETLADNPTVNVDGTYADGTSFSFDFCTK